MNLLSMLKHSQVQQAPCDQDDIFLLKKKNLLSYLQRNRKKEKLTPCITKFEKKYTYFHLKIKGYFSLTETLNLVQKHQV